MRLFNFKTLNKFDLLVIFAGLIFLGFEIINANNADKQMFLALASIVFIFLYVIIINLFNKKEA